MLPTADPEPTPVQVSLHDAVDGSHRVDVEPGPGVAREIFWVGDRLVVVVTGGDRSAVRAYGITPAGEIAWRRPDPTAHADDVDGVGATTGLLRVSTAVQAGDRVVIAWADATTDELLVVRQDDGLVLLGPIGQLWVRHVRDVAALDPLVVHGVGGIMRLDRGLLAGEG